MNTGSATCSDEIGLSIEIITSGISIADMLVELDLVSEETSDATETLHELEALLRLVSDKLNLNTEATVVITEPLSQRVLLNDIVVLACLLILEVLCVLFLGRVQEDGCSVALNGVLENISVYLKILEEHHGLESTDLHCLHGVLNTEYNHAGIKRNLFEELAH